MTLPSTQRKLKKNGKLKPKMVQQGIIKIIKIIPEIKWKTEKE